MTVTLLAIGLLAAVLTPRARAHAQDRPFSLPPGWVEEVLVSNLGAPTAFALAPDGRIYIALKAGRVKVLDNGELQNGAFVDWTSETNSYADRGLMGIALHPDFPDPAWVYLAYVWEPPGAPADAAGRRSARIVRVTADSQNLNFALPDSLQVIVGAGGTAEAIGALDVHDRAPFACSDGSGEYVPDCLPVDGPSHTVDALRFGPDGALYITAGDATLQPEINLRAQSLDSLAGKVLRVDPETGAGLADNPSFDGDPWSNRSRVFARGMRNPFRFSFSPAGGLVLGDVGAESWEEINVVPAGANLGWPCFEGPMRARSDGACAGLRTADVTFAPWSYPHEGQYSAAIAGDYLPSEGLPEPWAGAYIYGDHNRAALLWLAPGWENGGGEADEFASNVVAPVQITTGPDGALYVLSFITGSLSRLSWVGGENQPPVARIAADETSGAIPLTVAFSSAESSDPDGDEVTVRWDFGDGGSSNEPNPTHTYARAGRFEARLTVTDPSGATHTALLPISAGNLPPVLKLTQTAGPVVPAPGDNLHFSASARDEDAGALPAADIRWSGVLHHNEHTHIDYANAVGGTIGVTWDDHGENTWLELCASAADEAGLEGRACVAIGAGAPDILPFVDQVPLAPAVAISTEGINAAEVSGTLPITTAVATTATETGAPVAPAPLATQAGLLLERWMPIGGATVADLMQSSLIDAPPDETAVVERLYLSGAGKDYGERLRGWLTPTTSGPTRFWLAADDGAELWLGSDEMPGAARLIASVPGWSRLEEYDKYPEQASAPVDLEAGARYYIEVRHKQADQKDGLSVAWQPPGAERVILGGQLLSPFVP